ncbi:hypothetical protein [Sorangium sp. So ce233]|uniref:hypothetical protein n=1 Tax=Sorangium sp. So ce233 TaxID=3133290 RepID=UPI003F6206CE
MGRKTVKGFGGLKRALEKDLAELQRRTVKATHRAADYGRMVAFNNAPVAFAELRDGIIDVPHARGAKVISTAPHSGAAEHGSRPHTPPLAPLVEWVRLRGMQGLEAGEGATGAPGMVASQIRALGDGSSTPVDAAVQVAWRIQQAIAKRGTKPTHFMARTVPEVEKLLDGFVKTHFREDL